MGAPEPTHCTSQHQLYTAGTIMNQGKRLQHPPHTQQDQH